MSWAGFSDEDLRRLKQPGSALDGPAPSNNSQASSRRVKKTQASRDRHLRPKNVTVTPGGHGDSLNSSQRLSQDPVHCQTAQQHSGVNEMDALSSKKLPDKLKDESVDNKTTKDVNQSNLSSSSKSDDTQHDKEILSKELDENTVLSREHNNLERFQQQQKAMEELNKKKREILTKAVAERKKKATAEASKLTQIQRELSHVDDLLIVDVSFLRNKIEEASRDYMEAQKRYDRAEKEFIESKIDLHKKSGQKELLTENLYSIIHENEIRKSKKLEQLTVQLELEVSDDVLVEMPVPLPLTLFTTGPSLQGSPCPVKASIQSPTSPNLSNNESSRNADTLNDERLQQGTLSHDLAGERSYTLSSSNDTPAIKQTNDAKHNELPDNQEPGKNDPNAKCDSANNKHDKELKESKTPTLAQLANEAKQQRNTQIPNT